MTLDEAISHLQSVISDPTREWSCQECKEEHEQLFRWLVELRERRSIDARREEDRIIEARYQARRPCGGFVVL